MSFIVTVKDAKGNVEMFNEEDEGEVQRIIKNARGRGFSHVSTILNKSSNRVEFLKKQAASPDPDVAIPAQTELRELANKSTAAEKSKSVWGQGVEIMKRKDSNALDSKDGDQDDDQDNSKDDDDEDDDDDEADDAKAKAAAKRYYRAEGYIIDRATAKVVAEVDLPKSVLKYVPDFGKTTLVKNANGDVIGWNDRPLDFVGKGQLPIQLAEPYDADMPNTSDDPAFAPTFSDAVGDFEGQPDIKEIEECTQKWLAGDTRPGRALGAQSLQDLESYAYRLTSQPQVLAFGKALSSPTDAAGNNDLTQQDQARSISPNQ